MLALVIVFIFFVFEYSDNIVEFKNYNHSMTVPFAIYADFEGLISKLNKMKHLL